MTTLGLTVLVSVLTGSGLVIVVWSLLPARPDPRYVLDQLAPSTAARIAAAADSSRPALSWWDRVGLAIMRSPVAGVLAVPERDLAVLRRPAYWYYGRVTIYFLTGLLFPTVLGALGALARLAGVNIIHIPFVIPVGAALACGAALAFLPGYEVRRSARNARSDFSRAVSAYIDLVIVESRAGSLPRQALERASEIGDSWVFVRISEVLRRSQWTRQAPWESLRELADDLGVPDLADMADKMRLAGAQGAPVADQLQASVVAARAARLSQEVAAVNRRSGNLSIPVAALVFVFTMILIGAILLQLIGAGA